MAPCRGRLSVAIKSIAKVHVLHRVRVSRVDASCACKYFSSRWRPRPRREHVREYMRGVYWAEMPNYAEKNELQHERRLPTYFWSGKTRMNCVKKAVEQSLQTAYAHHIQRLMVTGNFMLLAGVHPDEADCWYLGIYIDALQWVEITNTRGMSQFADGGIVGTKPYVSSAN